MELGEGVGDPLTPLTPLSTSLTSLLASSSRLVLSDSPTGISAYRPWEHPADSFYHVFPATPTHISHHPHPQAPVVGPSQPSPHGSLTQLTQLAPTHIAPTPITHYAVPTVSSVFVESYPHVTVCPPNKLPPFSALSPERGAVASPLPSFNTLPSPHARYPLVPAPVQAREIPTVQLQLMDERHIHMFESPQSESDPSSTTAANGSPSKLVVVPPPITPAINVAAEQQTQQPPLPQQPPQTPSFDGVSSGSNHVPGPPPARRARRSGANTTSTRHTNNSTEEDSTVSGTENCGQVSSISSSAAASAGDPSTTVDSSFRSPQSQPQTQPITQPQATPPQQQAAPAAAVSAAQEEQPEKPVKKKRKRCGDCGGCQRKDNCGDCAPCRNDKSHQICKMRRCDKLTEKRTPRGEKMDRRGSGMGPMMPFFPASGIAEQPTAMNTTEMNFPHMRDRFSNNVWAPENQSQWGAFHPPNLSSPAMGPPSHPPHQFNQYESRQPVFTFSSGSTPAQASNNTPVSQYNGGFNSQFNGVASDPNAPFVPQGHYSPQNPNAAVQFNNGPPNGFLTHPQGNGVITNQSSHPHINHAYPNPTGEYHHQQQPHHHQLQQQSQQHQSNHIQQGVFKSPLTSPAVSVPDASPVHSGFVMTTLPSPHGHNVISSDQTAVASSNPQPVHVSTVTSYPNHVATECASLPQTSPHTSIAPPSSTPNGGSTVQNRLKNMIMSRQGSNGSQGSSNFSPGPSLTESPPLGELRFSGSVAAVTSVVSSSEASQVQESFKMAENFLAYRTTESDPGSVVQYSSGDKGSSEDSLSTAKNLDICTKPNRDSGFISQNTISDGDKQNPGNSSTYNTDTNSKDGVKFSFNSSAKLGKIDTEESNSSLKKPEEALAELFNEPTSLEMQNTFTEQKDVNVSRPSTFIGQSNTDPPDKETSEPVPVSSSQTSVRVPSSTHPCLTHLSSSTITTSVTSSVASLASSDSIANSNSALQFTDQRKEDSPFLDDKCNNLSVYDFPDSPDQQVNRDTQSGFRLGRSRGAGVVTAISSTITAHLPPACASGFSSENCGLQLPASGTSVDGSSISGDGVLPLPTGNSVPAITSRISAFSSHSPSVPAESSRNECLSNLSSLPLVSYSTSQNQALSVTSSHSMHYSSHMSNATPASFQDFACASSYQNRPDFTQNLPIASSASPQSSNMCNSVLSCVTPLESSSLDSKNCLSKIPSQNVLLPSSAMPSQNSKDNLSSALSQVPPQNDISFQNVTLPLSIPSSNHSQNLLLHTSSKSTTHSSSLLSGNDSSNSMIDSLNMMNHLHPHSGSQQFPTSNTSNSHVPLSHCTMSNSNPVSSPNIGGMQDFRGPSHLSRSPFSQSANPNMSMLASQNNSHHRLSSNQNLLHPVSNQCFLDAQSTGQNISSHHLTPTASHFIPSNGSGYSNFYPHHYSQMPPQGFPHQFHSRSKFSPMHLMQHDQRHYHPSQHPIRNMTNFVMNPNQMQSPLQPELSKSSKKPSPKKPRKGRVTKKQKQAMEKQQKEDLEKAKLQELQKEEMEKSRFREMQMRHNNFQQPVQPQPMFMQNKMSPFANQPRPTGIPFGINQDFMGQQWPHGQAPHSLGQSHFQNISNPFQVSDHPTHSSQVDATPQLSAFSQPVKSKAQESKSSKKKCKSSDDFEALHKESKLHSFHDVGSASLPMSGCNSGIATKGSETSYSHLSRLQNMNMPVMHNHSGSSISNKEHSSMLSGAFPQLASQRCPISSHSSSFEDAKCGQNITSNTASKPTNDFLSFSQHQGCPQFKPNSAIKKEPIDQVATPDHFFAGTNFNSFCKQEPLNIKSEFASECPTSAYSGNVSGMQYPSFGSESNFPLMDIDKPTSFNSSSVIPNNSNPTINETQNIEAKFNSGTSTFFVEKNDTNPSQPLSIQPNTFNHTFSTETQQTLSNMNANGVNRTPSEILEPGNYAVSSDPSSTATRSFQSDLLSDQFRSNNQSTPTAGSCVSDLATIDAGSLTAALPDPVAAMQYPPYGGQVPLAPSSDLAFVDEDQWKRKIRLNEFISPKCSCSIPPGTAESGPVYSHLGHGRTAHEVRRSIEERTGYSGRELRLEKIAFTGKEGKTDSGCPLPKWIIRRSGECEKVLVLVKRRGEHVCEFSWIVVVLVAWEGVPPDLSDRMYDALVDKLNAFATPTERRCGTNEERTCVCQGVDKDKCGASFSFGCSWSMYYNMCKFARSRNSRKFKLSDEKEEALIEEKFQTLATALSPLYARFAPAAYRNQVCLEEESAECRLGAPPGRPWTGVTACVDFCAHSHKDNHNMNNGCTVVATLTKHRGLEKPDDEQYHVLPLYVLDTSFAEHDRQPQQLLQEKIDAGALEVLQRYPCEIRVRSEPLLSCRARSLLARGLPVPSSTRGRSKAALKARGGKSAAGRDIVTFTRKSSDDGALSGLLPVSAPKKKWDAKSVGDKLGLDVDLLLKSGPLEQVDYDDLGKYNIDNEDWQLGLENEETTVKPSPSTFDICAVKNPNSEAKEKDSSAENGASSFLIRSSSGSNGGPGDSSSPLADFSDHTSMPPPESPAPKKQLPSPPSEAGLTTVAGTPQPQEPCPATSSPPAEPRFSPITSESPGGGGGGKESALPSPAPRLSPPSPQMPSLSPHVHQSSPRSPATTLAANQETSAALQVGAGSLPATAAPSQSSCSSVPAANSHLPTFAPSLNSPEMPHLSPHVTTTLNSTVFGAQDRNYAAGLASFSNHSPSCSSANRKAEVSEWSSSRSPSHTSSGGADDVKPFSYSTFSDNLENFKDSSVGGVSIALSHRSVLFEFAKQELHATTALKCPDRTDPKRISLIFYHHKNLIHRNHGWSELENKMMKKKEIEKASKPLSAGDGLEQVVPKRKRTNKGSAKQKDKGAADFGRLPPNGVKKLKTENKLDGASQGLAKNGATVAGPINSTQFHQTPNFGICPAQTDLISPPSNGSAYQRSVPSVGETVTGQPFSPSSQRSATLTPSFSIPSKSPHLSLKSPSLDTSLQPPKPSPHADFIAAANVNQLSVAATGASPFTGQQLDYNPYHTPGSSPFHNPNHFSPYMDLQSTGPFNAAYQGSGGNLFPKALPQPAPVNYANTTYVPPPFYGLTPPYSPGPQQQSQHAQSQMNASSFPHAGLPPGVASSLSYDENVIRGMAATSQHSASPWPTTRHVSPFPGHAAYSPWPGGS